MKPSAILINTSRGEIIDEKALCQALQKRRIAGAAIDVMKGENQDGSHLVRSPLLKYARENNNFLIVPHTGGAAYEAMQITEEFIAGLVKRHIL
jgi:phosphoglycerate dehydrogenase-like enzyme